MGFEDLHHVYFGHNDWEGRGLAYALQVLNGTGLYSPKPLPPLDQTLRGLSQPLCTNQCVHATLICSTSLEIHNSRAWRVNASSVLSKEDLSSCSTTQEFQKLFLIQVLISSNTGLKRDAASQQPT